MVSDCFEVLRMGHDVQNKVLRFELIMTALLLGE